MISAPPIRVILVILQKLFMETYNIILNTFLNLVPHLLTETVS